MSRRDLVFLHRHTILALARDHGAAELRLMGSVARGDEHPASDIDFLVKMQRGYSLLDRAKLEVALEDLLGCSVDVVNERGAKPGFLSHVKAESIPL